MELPSLLEETGSEITLLEQGMRRLHDSIAATKKEYLEEVELCTLLTTVVENIHAVSHFEHETFTALQYSQDFGTITKETLQKSAIAFESIKFMQPLPSAEISAETETAMKELVEKHRPVRQRTVRGETTKDKAGALPPAVYTKLPDCSKVNFMPDEESNSITEDPERLNRDVEDESALRWPSNDVTEVTFVNDCLILMWVVGAVRPPQEDEYDTASDNDISDTRTVARQGGSVKWLNKTTPPPPPTSPPKKPD